MYKGNQIKKIAIFTFVLSCNFYPAIATDFDPSVPLVQGGQIDANNKATLMNSISQRNDLSPDAKNITVVFQNGSTILRGVVKDDRERQTIGSLAAQAGITNVKNELTIRSTTSASKAQIKNNKPLVINRIKKQ